MHGNLAVMQTKTAILNADKGQLETSANWCLPRTHCRPSVLIKKHVYDWHVLMEHFDPENETLR